MARHVLSPGGQDRESVAAAKAMILPTAESLGRTWAAPEWRAPDRELLDGKVPASLGDCIDPVGAQLYLAFKARSRIQSFLLGRRPSTARGLAYVLRALSNEISAVDGGCARPALPNRRTLGRLHRVLHERLIPQVEGSHVAEIQLAFAPAEKPPGIRAEWWRQAQTVAEEIRREGGMAVLQGSQADGETTAFSDIDLWMVGDFRSRELRALKDQLDQLVLAADPLQHHGVFWVDRRDLDSYWPMQLPTSALRYARVLHAPADLRIVEFEEPYGAASHLNATLKKWSSIVEGDVRPSGMWQWKFWLSELMLIPTLVLAAGGKNVYKGESFSLCSPMYSDSAWGAIEMATEVRAIWPSASNIDTYLSQASRRFGILADDTWPVVPNVDLLSQSPFASPVQAFLNETRELVGL